MKTTVLLSLMIFCLTLTYAQDSTKVGNLVDVKEGSGRTEVGILNDRIHIEDDYSNDTTHIRIGNRNVEVIEKEGRTTVNMHRDGFRDKKKDNWRHKGFDGHWGGFELGINTFYDDGHFGGTGFMSLNQSKSMEVNINFLEYNIVLSDQRVGLVTGMGWTMNNYRFDNAITLQKVDGQIVPLELEHDGLKKSKLTVSYLTIPLLLEFQIPVNDHSNEVYISGGLIGGFNLGSHTKVKTDRSKSKDHGNFNINPFKYAVTGRVGLKDIGVYATYNLSSIFKDGGGPEFFPFSVGISIVNF
ncbi:outer membrane beta-barrel protein [uncultured Sunxiuqinia sp.]|uniref:outer membrane beta-barrel protein n=1 Tax=Sunxiuqinia rutila TaxID=1397841 RepID=UPI00261A23CE|nr:outer membrane beta-barrel protein [uncultured Sunxiuqinia sp.]